MNALTFTARAGALGFAAAALTSGVAHAQPASGGLTATLVNFLPIILIVLIFWFLIIQPQRKRMREHQQMVANLAKGDHVVTGGGFLGKVTAVTPDEVTVEIADGVKVRVVKSTIQDVQAKTQPAPANDTAAGDGAQ